MKKILLPVDGSEASLKAAEYALELASNTSARVDLLHVMPTRLDFKSLTPGGYCPDMGHFEREHEEEIRKILNRIADRSKEKKIEVTTRVESGHISKTIIRLAQRGCYNLIVMGTKAAGPLAKFFFGSISDEIVQKAPCPVLVVH